ncbi:DUF397 domain-containing protein [Kitasatospora phosalacinea]|uniref:DUF397 domain-containing protein n=1 Tax=Kitasatospora phosalacinea TaxID=2065 RepID=A0A9W6PB48_9ACTN|nr:DUF397 domain-containing protein [Kitasatospora phosalacinea]GLW52490.1 hypothetical protein Kpho01_05010 [Kitasatospora phosalacinea]
MSTTSRPSPTDLEPGLVTWRKSSYSDPQGQGDCIEIAEAYTASHGLVAVRDSKNPTGPALLVPVTAWNAFATATAAGEFGTV